MKLSNEERDLIVAEALASIVHHACLLGDIEADVLILGQVVVFNYYAGYWWPAGTHYSYTYRHCDTLEKAIINYLKITRRRKT